MLATLQAHEFLVKVSKTELFRTTIEFLHRGLLACVGSREPQLLQLSLFFLFDRWVPIPRHGVGTPTREPRPDMQFWLVVSSSVTNDSLARCWPVHPRSTDAISCFQGPRTASYFFLLTCAHLFFLFLPPARCFHQVSFSTFSVPDPLFRTRLHEFS